MRNRAALHLSLTRAGFLAVAAMAALAGPILFGIVNVKAGEAQSVAVQAPRPAATQIASEPQAGTRGTATPGPVRDYRISEINVIGFHSPPLSSELIRSLLGMGVDDIYDESRLRKAFEDMRKLYGSLGYVNFLPEPTFDFDEARKMVALTIKIDEGTPYFVNRITFTGNTTTRNEVLQHEVLLKEGEVFNSSLLDDTLARLNQTGIFEAIKPEDARIDLLPNEPKLDIDIRVKEKGR